MAFNEVPLSSPVSFFSPPSFLKRNKRKPNPDLQFNVTKDRFGGGGFGSSRLASNRKISGDNRVAYKESPDWRENIIGNKKRMRPNWRENIIGNRKRREVSPYMNHINKKECK